MIFANCKPENMKYRNQLIYGIVALTCFSLSAQAMTTKEVAKIPEFKQWMIGVGQPSGELHQIKSWKGTSLKHYNIKGSVNKKFLQYEKQGSFGGINIGWTNNATAKTGGARAKWFFTRPSNLNTPLYYGEHLAIAWPPVSE
jgi:hypothetical protein